MTKWGSYVLLIFGVAVQTVWLIDPPKDVFFGVVFFGLGALFFFGLGFFGLRIVRKAPSYAIAVDDAGIRYVQGRPTMEEVKWTDLIGVRERHSLQRLDVLSRQGFTLRVEYQLEKFDELRAIILSRVKAAAGPLLPFAHQKSFLFHVFYALSIWLLIYGAYYYFALGSGGEQELYLSIGLSVLCVFIVREYWTHVIGVKITHLEVVLKYPFRFVSIDVSHIAAVELKDDFVKQSRIPFVFIKLLSGKSYSIKSAGVDAIQLVAALEAARGKAAVC